MHNSKEFAIISYLQNATSGIFRCSREIARNIIDLVKAVPSGYVIKQKQSAKGYEPVRIIRLEAEAMKDIALKAIATTAADAYYRYDCYLADGTQVTSVYSFNPHLFD